MALQFLAFCSTFLFFSFAMLQGIYHSLYKCIEWIVHFFPVKSAKVKSMIAGIILLCCTACISISMWIIDVSNIYQYLVRYGVVVSNVKTVNFLSTIVTIFKVITFLEVTAAAFSLCSRIFASALSIKDPIYHSGGIKEYGKHEKKYQRRLLMKLDVKKKLQRMYPFSFTEQCNPDSMLLTPKKTENLFSSDLVVHVKDMVPPDEKRDEDHG